MPKPHSIDQVRDAAYNLFGREIGNFDDMNRLYVRRDGKFKPIGYEITFRKVELKSGTNRMKITYVKKYVRDYELGI